MKSISILFLLFTTTSVFALENRTSDLPWTDYPAQGAPTISEFCKNVIGNEQLSWGKKTTVSCAEKAAGIIEITAVTTNREGVQRSATISGLGSHKMYMEISGDYIYKYKNDLGEALLLSTRFVHTGQKLTFQGIQEKGYYEGDLRLIKGDISLRFGFTDLE